ncbi:MAG: hypothetical protein WAM14_25760 [Candidatus Nitrosopolaris sp.]
MNNIWIDEEMKTWGFVTQDEEHDFWATFYKNPTSPNYWLLDKVSNIISERIDKKASALARCVSRGGTYSMKKLVCGSCGIKMKDTEKGAHEATYGHHVFYDVAETDKMKAALVSIPLILCLTISGLILCLMIGHVFAYMTSESEDIGTPDIEKKCGNTNASNSCFDIGVKSGLVAGNESKHTDDIQYSLVGGCGGQHSANFCYGYFLGYSRTYGHPINNTEIWNTGNKTGGDIGSEYGANPQKIPCNVSTLFCSAYVHGYHQSYVYHVPYWIGYDTGEKFAENLIKKCHEENHPIIAGHHSQAYKTGWSDGYEDATGAATNDVGAPYGKNCYKYY